MYLRIKKYYPYLKYQLGTTADRLTVSRSTYISRLTFSISTDAQHVCLSRYCMSIEILYVDRQTWSSLMPNFMLRNDRKFWNKYQNIGIFLTFLSAITLWCTLACKMRETKIIEVTWFKVERVCRWTYCMSIDIHVCISIDIQYVNRDTVCRSRYCMSIGCYITECINKKLNRNICNLKRDICISSRDMSIYI